MHVSLPECSNRQTSELCTAVSYMCTLHIHVVVACGSEGYGLCVSEHSSDANADPANIITLHMYCECTSEERSLGQGADHLAVLMRDVHMSAAWD